MYNFLWLLLKVIVSIPNSKVPLIVFFSGNTKKSFMAFPGNG